MAEPGSVEHLLARLVEELERMNDCLENIESKLESGTFYVNVVQP